MHRILPMVFLCAVPACSDAEVSSPEFDSPNATGKDGTSSSGGSLGSSGGAPNSGGSTACVPNAEHFEVAGNNCDDDADGKVDNVEACDSGIAVNGAEAEFAKALGLCKTASGTGWGVVKAQYLNGFQTGNGPNPDQHGILPKFGDALKPREGQSLGVLSTGFAREYNAASGTRSFNQSNQMQGAASRLPPGFPKFTGGCPSSNKTFDASVVHLEIRAPKNAKGFAFDFNFLTSEWPQYLCSAYNDAFIAYLTRANGTAENVSVDAQKNPVNVNLGFFDRCTPNVQTGCWPGGSPSVSTCPGGPSELAGTGFGRVSRASASFADEESYCRDSSTGGGGTGWLSTQVPIEPGEAFSLDFMIWDTGDGDLDSSVLLDHFRWIPTEVKVTETGRPPS
jgi:hypothetical protein